MGEWQQDTGANDLATFHMWRRERSLGGFEIAHIFFTDFACAAVARFASRNRINARIARRYRPNRARRLGRTAGERKKGGKKQDWQGPADARCCR